MHEFRTSLRCRRLFAFLSASVMVVATLVAAAAAPKSFDVPVGPAERTLLRFSEEAGVQLLFPIDLVQGIQTAPIQGTLEPRAALEAMLAGTTLLVVVDPETGALGVRRAQAQVAAPAQAAAPTATSPVMLPPLTVTEQGVPWQFAETPGFEFLSRCSNKTTTDYITGMTRAMALLDLFVPGNFRLESNLPQVVILTSPGTTSAMSENLLNSLSPPREPTAAPMSDGDVLRRTPLDDLKQMEQVQSKLHFMRDMELVDKDRSIAFSTIQEASFDPNKIFVRPGHLEYLLESRRPALPKWLTAAIMKVYGGGKTALTRDGASLPSFEWGSASETKRIVNDAKYRAQVLLPLEQFVGAEPSVARDAEAELLVRWSMDSWQSAQESSYVRLKRAAQSGKESQPNREAFWKFVDRAIAGPTTELTIRECFGVSSVELQARLADYLREAARNPLRLRLADLPSAPPATMRNATPAEVARLKGDWERLETSYVTVYLPEYARGYAYQTRATLKQAYDRGIRDPEVLGSLGLFECNVGNDLGAKPYLEAAMQGKIRRGQVYYELARIRLAEVRMRPEGEDRLLSDAQVRYAIEPLRLGYTHLPALRDIYDLAAVIWSRGRIPLSRGDLALLETGLKYFPNDANLTYKAAVVYASRGFRKETSRLVALALTQNPASEDRGLLADVEVNTDPTKGMAPLDGLRNLRRSLPRPALEAIVWAAGRNEGDTLAAVIDSDALVKSTVDGLLTRVGAELTGWDAGDGKMPARLLTLFFRDVTGFQILDQENESDRAVALTTAIRDERGTINLLKFHLQWGDGGWRLHLTDGDIDEMSHLVVPRQRNQSQARAREPAVIKRNKSSSASTKTTADVLVVADVLEDVPMALRPQAGRPVYFHIMSAKQSDIGSTVHGEPQAEAKMLEREVVEALAREGFVQTQVGGPIPSLAITLEWGSANLDLDEYTVQRVPPGKPEGKGDSAQDPFKSLSDDYDFTGVTTAFRTFNRQEMMMLVGADKVTRTAMTTNELAQLDDAMAQRRGYIFVGAFDASTLLKGKKPKLLWRTRMSIGTRDHSLPESLAVMLASGAPFFGRDEERPIFVTEADRKGEVQIGTPMVVPEDRPARDEKSLGR